MKAKINLKKKKSINALFIIIFLIIILSINVISVSIVENNSLDVINIKNNTINYSREIPLNNKTLNNSLSLEVFEDNTDENILIDNIYVKNTQNNTDGNNFSIDLLSLSELEETLINQSLFDETLNPAENNTNDSQKLQGQTIVNTMYIVANGETIASIKSDEPGEISYYVQDHLGSNRMIIKGTNTEWTGDYFAFGEQRNIQEIGTDNNYQFTGKEFDEESGLFYYGARYYSSELGRFIQADPILGSIQDPLTLNRYVYVKNNPLKFTDPTGNVVKEDPSVAKLEAENPAFKKAMENLRKTDLYKKIDAKKNYLWEIKVVSRKDAQVKEENRKIKQKTGKDVTVGGFTGATSEEDIQNMRNDGAPYQYGDYSKIVKDVPFVMDSDKEGNAEVVYSQRLFHESKMAEIDMNNPSEIPDQLKRERQAWSYTTTMLTNLRDCEGDFTDGPDKSYLSQGKKGAPIQPWIDNAQKNKKDLYSVGRIKTIR